MSFRFSCIFALLIASGPLAYAGGWSSGGGNALVCFDSKDLAKEVSQRGVITDEMIAHITSIRALDLFLLKLHPAPIKAGEVLSAYLLRMVSAYPRIPKLKELLEHSMASVARGTVLHQSSPLDRQSDVTALVFEADKVSGIPLEVMKKAVGIRYFYNSAGEYSQIVVYQDPAAILEFPGNCSIATVSRAYIEKNDDGHLATLILDDRLYYHPAHSRMSQAVLLMHELLYLQGLARNHLDSSNTRALLNGILRSESRLSDAEMKRLLADTHFDIPPSTEIEDHEFVSN